MKRRASHTKLLHVYMCMASLHLCMHMYIMKNNFLNQGLQISRIYGFVSSKIKLKQYLHSYVWRVAYPQNFYPEIAFHMEIYSTPQNFSS